MSLLNFIFTYFKYVVVFDFEYRQQEGNNPEPVCVACKDLKTGKVWKQWLIGRKPKFPYPLQDTLFICHHAVAEVSCMLELGWGRPDYIWDTLVQEKKLYNGLYNDGYSLLASCKRYQIKTITLELKNFWRKSIVEKYPNYTDKEVEGIIDYNESDVIENEKLFLAHLKEFESRSKNFKKIISQATFHGCSVGVSAKIERNGIPINLKLHKELSENFDEVKRLEIEEINTACDIYEDGKFKHSKFEAFLKREGIYDNWPKTKTGKAATDDRTLYRWQEVNEKIKLYRNAKFIIDSKKLRGVCIGKDGRSRAPLNMLGQITGRTNVSTKLNPFGAPRRMRNLIGTDKEHFLVYADWKSQEAAIQAALSKDPEMIKAVNSGDPYIYTAIKVDAAPAGATKESHPKIREIYKQSFLAIAYGQSPFGLQGKLECSLSEASFIHYQLETLYVEYFKWNKGVIAQASLKGYLESVFGWCYYLTSREKVNPRRLANWPLQTQGSESLRRAIIDLDNAGFEISMPIHDAVLIHMERKGWREMLKKIKELKKIMTDATAQVIGWKIPVDIKIIRDQFYQDTKNQKLWDRLYEKVLKAKAIKNKGGCTNNGQ